MKIYILKICKRRRVMIAFAISLLAVVSVGCGCSDGRMAEIEAERDSLRVVNANQ